MTIDFEQEVDHYGVNSIKWEFVVDDRVLKHWDLTDPENRGPISITHVGCRYGFPGGTAHH
ncbi:MAG: hypothetical protein Ct9H300mP14_05310 [Gammaproteobacteria bacterium]|nr:MAG: hypothetical protein Ct9H300mP14_05310 [Gammaproteobacteria bacterium]